MKNFKMLIYTSLMVAITFLLIACTQVPGFGDQLNGKFVEIKKGYYSNYPGEGEVQKVITSPSDFSNEWHKVFSSRSPEPEVPNIDFTDHQVILVMLETKSSGGFGITDFKVTESDSEVIISYSEVKPGKGCMVTQALTRPFYIASVPNNEKKVQFYKKDPVVNDCN
ncbi:MAG: protease complex subunit PrcB family protein [Balneolaceae bacterium]